VGTPCIRRQILTGAEATVRSDIYSLGVLLYHLVTGDFPVRGATLGELVSAHAGGKTVPLADVRSDLPRAFVRVVEQATDRDPARRFTTAGRLETSLAQFLGSSTNRTAAPRIRTTAPRAKARGAGHVGRGREPGIPSVAVLPFSDMSAAKDQEFFCDGWTEEIINALTQISGLHVAARTSAFQFKGRLEMSATSAK
jgi:serine/threonine protein kinase